MAVEGERRAVEAVEGLTEAPERSVSVFVVVGEPLGELNIDFVSFVNDECRRR